MQRQLDDTIRNYAQSACNLLSAEMLEKLGKDVIRIADALEQYGLVDYQQGIWETEILHGKHSRPKITS